MILTMMIITLLPYLLNICSSADNIFYDFYQLTKEIVVKCKDDEQWIILYMINHVDTPTKQSICSNTNVMNASIPAIQPDSLSNSSNHSLTIPLAYLQLWADLIHFFTKRMLILRPDRASEAIALINSMQSLINDAYSKNEQYCTFSTNQSATKHAVIGMVAYLHSLISQCL